MIPDNKSPLKTRRYILYVVCCVHQETQQPDGDQLQSDRGPAYVPQPDEGVARIRLHQGHAPRPLCAPQHAPPGHTHLYTALGER